MGTLLSCNSYRIYVFPNRPLLLSEDYVGCFQELFSDLCFGDYCGRFWVIFWFKLMELRCYSHYKEVRRIIEDPLFRSTVCLFFFFFLCFYCSLFFILYSCFYVLCILIMFKGVLLFIVYFLLESFIYMLCISVIFIHITYWFCTVIFF